MTPDQFADVERISLAALSKPSKARAAYLDEACQGDGELRAQVERLLAGAAAAADFLEMPPVVPAVTLGGGQRLGPYEILASIGAGGMGEVYRARDTRLDRTVAIKVLRAEVSADPDRRARFEREARTVASLSHPHICPLFDVGDHNGSLFLVMEHLIGESLEARIARGRLPLGQALTVATEIAEALAAAHRQGIIHRDLKPGNVMLTKSGVKLLDFGLAKLKRHSDEPAVVLPSVSDRKATLTAQGTIVGTLQYMAPEQIEGNAVDARTDLWALGAILYEMVTGRRAFEADSTPSLVAAILGREPAPMPTLQPMTPRALDRLVRQCLAKSPDDRPDTAHDVARELCGLMDAAPPASPVRPRRAHLPAAAWVGLALVGGIALGVAGFRLLSPPPVPALQRPVRAVLDIAPAEQVTTGGSFAHAQSPGGSRTAMTWTPDGRTLIFAGVEGRTKRLYRARIETGEVRAIDATETAMSPAISPDGQWVAFWRWARNQSDRVLVRVRLTGGAPVPILALPQPPWGLAWDTDGSLLFGGELLPIRRLRPGGTPENVTTLKDDELSHGHPWLLPGGQAFLYTVRRRNSSWGDEDVAVKPGPGAPSRILVHNATDGRYLPTGHLLFVRLGQLFAVPFNLQTLALAGTPELVLDSVGQALQSTISTDRTGAGQFAVSSHGTLAWIPGAPYPLVDRSIVSVDRKGQVTPLSQAQTGMNDNLRLSPDGSRLALQIFTLTDVSLWLYDLAHQRFDLLNKEGESACPVWTPDGRSLWFKWVTAGRTGLATVSADGESPPRVVVPSLARPSSFAPDGQRLLLADPANESDIVVATPANGIATIEPLVSGPAREMWPEFSPDGRWMVFGSNVSGKNEVYVQAYPTGSRTHVSIDGGGTPAWNPNGREIFFHNNDEMLGVAFEPGIPPRVGSPKRLFKVPSGLSFACYPTRCYDVSPDGERFFVTRDERVPEPERVTRINLVVNWLEELKRKVPPR